MKKDFDKLNREIIKIFSNYKDEKKLIEKIV